MEINNRIFYMKGNKLLCSKHYKQVGSGLYMIYNLDCGLVDIIKSTNYNGLLVTEALNIAQIKENVIWAYDRDSYLNELVEHGYIDFGDVYKLSKDTIEF